MLNDEWLTPPELLRALGPFALDPCAPVVRPWDTAERHYTVEDDGLSIPWVGRVWLTINENDIISPCRNDCPLRHQSSVLNAEQLSRLLLNISVPAPADHSAFAHIAGSAWHRPPLSENAKPGSSVLASDDSMLNTEYSVARSAEQPTRQRWNTLAQKQPAAMDFPLGAANVPEYEREKTEKSLGDPNPESKKSKKRRSGMPTPSEERKLSKQVPGFIMPNDGREHQGFPFTGALPTGWTVSAHSEASVPIADRRITCTKTTSYRSHTLIVPELLAETWSRPAAHATSQKEPSIRVPGLRMKLRSLGLLKPCGCFVGTYQPRIWLNPPFGKEAVKWLRRLRDHGEGIALIPARTETEMFFETVWGHADGVLFLKSRPHFHYVDGRRAKFNSGAPMVLVAYGQGNLEVLRECGLGFVVPTGLAPTSAPQSNPERLCA